MHGLQSVNNCQNAHLYTVYMCFGSVQHVPRVQRSRLLRFRCSQLSPFHFRLILGREWRQCALPINSPCIQICLILLSRSVRVHRHPRSSRYKLFCSGKYKMSRGRPKKIDYSIVTDTLNEFKDQIETCNTDGEPSKYSIDI